MTDTIAQAIAEARAQGAALGPSLALRNMRRQNMGGHGYEALVSRPRPAGARQAEHTDEWEALARRRAELERLEHGG